MAKKKVTKEVSKEVAVEVNKSPKKDVKKVFKSDKEELEFLRKRVADLEKEIAENQEVLAKAKGFLDNIGKGRPKILTDEHLKTIDKLKNKLVMFGGDKTVVWLHGELVKEHGYQGSTASIRRYLKGE